MKRVAITSTAALVNLVEVPLIEIVEALGIDVNRLPVTFLNKKFMRWRRFATFETEGRCHLVNAAAEVRGLDVIGIDTPPVDCTHAATPLSGTCTVGPELILQHRVRINQFV